VVPVLLELPWQELSWKRYTNLYNSSESLISELSVDWATAIPLIIVKAKAAPREKFIFTILNP